MRWLWWTPDEQTAEQAEQTDDGGQHSNKKAKITHVAAAGQFVPNNAGIVLVTVTELLTEMINKVESMDKVEKGFKDSANYASINMKLHDEVTSPELPPTVL